MEKKKVSKLMLLNCLTLGIYGAVQHQRLGNEINALFDGDGEQPRFGYMGSVLLALIYPALTVILGFIVSSAFSMDYVTRDLVSSFMFGDAEDIMESIASMFGQLMARTVFMQPLYIAVGIVGLLTRIYRNYWWYKQSGRIKLNGGRFGIVVRESGTDTILFRTLVEVPLIVVTAVSWFLHLLVPGIICLLAFLISQGFGIVIAVICLTVFCLFARDCTAGAYLATYFMYKNMNRIADAGASGSSFDPMGYEYYPSIQNHYANFAPQMVYGEFRVDAGSTPPPPPPQKEAFLEATRGSLKGYTFDLTPGEEVVIGRNPSEANVVIDNMYDKVSGRHVGIMFEAEYDTFRVVDYSLNGTYVDGQKLENGKEYSFRRGARIELVDGKNAFRLK